MSTQANTRLFKGSILNVDDLALGWVSTGKMTKVSGFGAPATEIPVATAASTLDEVRLGIPDQGDATFEFFLNLDDAFQQEMNTMRTNQETRTFTLVLPEGTKTTGTFSAFVLDNYNVTGAYNSVFKMNLVLCVVSEVVWAVP